MKLLVIGGSAFLGRAIVECAVRDGHKVSVFNRGLTRSNISAEIEHIAGDRSANLDRLHGRHWDAIIDTCAYSSQSVELAGQELKDVTDSYTLISSVSVYKSFGRPNVTENVSVYDDALVGEDVSDVSTYGPRKALCESAAKRWFKCNSTIVRLGMLIGPYDYFPRFSYWLKRIAAGGDFIVPGKPSNWIQLIDVRDAAHFIVQATSDRLFGAFNVTEPAFNTTFGMMISTCREATESVAEPVWIPDDQLLKHGFNSVTFPYWTSAEMHPGYFSISTSKACSFGLHCRPLIDSARDTFLWLRDSMFAEQDDPSARTLIASLSAAGLPADREREIISDWHNSQLFECSPLG